MPDRPKYEKLSAYIQNRYRFMSGGSAGQLPDRLEYEKLFACFMVFIIALTCERILHDL